MTKKKPTPSFINTFVKASLQRRSSDATISTTRSTIRPSVHLSGPIRSSKMQSARLPERFENNTERQFSQKNQKEQKNQKALYWNSGTTTDEETSRKAIDTERLENLGVKTGVHVGIGTKEHSKLADYMKDEENPFMELSLFDSPIAGFYRGYKEKDQLVSVVAFMDFIIPLLEKGPADIVIGGHSRGADEATRGQLAALVAILEAAPKDSLLRENLKSLSILQVDPCPGLKENDILGAEDVEMKDLIRRLKDQLPETKIEVTVASSRFDSLKPGLTLSQKTQTFIDELGTDALSEGKSPKGIVVSNSSDGPDTYFTAGFYHSGMMEPGTEANDLLKLQLDVLLNLDEEIAHDQKVENYNTHEKFVEKYIEVSAHELDKIESLENGTASEAVLRETGPRGPYGMPGYLIGAVRLQKELKDNPNKRTPRVNGRKPKNPNIIARKKLTQKIRL